MPHCYRTDKLLKHIWGTLAVLVLAVLPCSWLQCQAKRLLGNAEQCWQCLSQGNPAFCTDTSQFSCVSHAMLKGSTLLSHCESQAIFRSQSSCALLNATTCSACADLGGGWCIGQKDAPAAEYRPYGACLPIQTVGDHGVVTPAPALACGGIYGQDYLVGTTEDCGCLDSNDDCGKCLSSHHGSAKCSFCPSISMCVPERLQHTPAAAASEDSIQLGSPGTRQASQCPCRSIKDCKSCVESTRSCTYCPMSWPKEGGLTGACQPSSSCGADSTTSSPYSYLYPVQPTNAADLCMSVRQSEHCENAQGFFTNYQSKQVSNVPKSKSRCSLCVTSGGQYCPSQDFCILSPSLAGINKAIACNPLLKNAAECDSWDSCNLPGVTSLCEDCASRGCGFEPYASSIAYGTLDAGTCVPLWPSKHENTGSPMVPPVSVAAKFLPVLISASQCNLLAKHQFKCSVAFPERLQSCGLCTSGSFSAFLPGNASAVSQPFRCTKYTPWPLSKSDIEEFIRPIKLSLAAAATQNPELGSGCAQCVALNATWCFNHTVPSESSCVPKGHFCHGVAVNATNVHQCSQASKCMFSVEQSFYRPALDPCQACTNSSFMGIDCKWSQRLRLCIPGYVPNSTQAADVRLSPDSCCTVLFGDLAASNEGSVYPLLSIAIVGFVLSPLMSVYCSLQMKGCSMRSDQPGSTAEDAKAVISKLHLALENLRVEDFSSPLGVGTCESCEQFRCVLQYAFDGLVFAVFYLALTVMGDKGSAAVGTRMIPAVVFVFLVKAALTHQRRFLATDSSFSLLCLRVILLVVFIVEGLPLEFQYALMVPIAIACLPSQLFWVHVICYMSSDNSYMSAKGKPTPYGALMAFWKAVQALATGKTVPYSSRAPSAVPLLNLVGAVIATICFASSIQEFRALMPITYSQNGEEQSISLDAKGCSSSTVAFELPMVCTFNSITAISPRLVQSLVPTIFGAYICLVCDCLVNLQAVAAPLCNGICMSKSLIPRQVSDNPAKCLAWKQIQILRRRSEDDASDLVSLLAITGAVAVIFSSTRIPAVSIQLPPGPLSPTIAWTLALTTGWMVTVIVCNGSQAPWNRTRRDCAALLDAFRTLASRETSRGTWQKIQTFGSWLATTVTGSMFLFAANAFINLVTFSYLYLVETYQLQDVRQQIRNLIFVSSFAMGWAFYNLAIGYARKANIQTNLKFAFFRWLPHDENKRVIVGAKFILIFLKLYVASHLNTGSASSAKGQQEFWAITILAAISMAIVCLVSFKGYGAMKSIAKAARKKSVVSRPLGSFKSLELFAMCQMALQIWAAAAASWILVDEHRQMCKNEQLWTSMLSGNTIFHITACLVFLALNEASILSLRLKGALMLYSDFESNPVLKEADLDPQEKGFTALQLAMMGVPSSLTSEGVISLHSNDQSETNYVTMSNGWMIPLKRLDTEGPSHPLIAPEIWQYDDLTTGYFKHLMFGTGCISLAGGLLPVVTLILRIGGVVSQEILPLHKDLYFESALNAALLCLLAGACLLGLFSFKSSTESKSMSRNSK